jgi:hypothetical protein
MDRILYRLKLVRPLLLPLIFYIGMLVVVTGTMDLLAGSPWRYALALLPLLPGIFIAAGVIKALRKLDELELKIIQDSMGIAFMLTLLLTIGLGMLETAGLPPISNMVIGVFMALAWLAGKLILTRRYQ